MRTIDDAARLRSAVNIGRVEAVPLETTRLSESSKMLVAISATGKHLYEGTVPWHVKEQRRRRNRAARRARRVHRR